MARSEERDIAKMYDRMQRFMDRQEIVECVYRMSRGLDRHDNDLIASAYHVDAMDQHGDFVGDVAELIAWGNARHETRTRAHSHHITCVLTDIDGDIAHSEAYAIVISRDIDGKTVNFSSARYLDRLEKRDGEWRISLRRMVVDARAKADGSFWTDIDPVGYPHGTWDRGDLSYQRPLTLPPGALAARKVQP